MHRTIFAIALAVFIALIVVSLVGCEPCHDRAGSTGYPGCVTDNWELH